MVLLHLFEEFLVSDNLQFGFKKNSSCPHALFAFSESVKYFTSNGTKVYSAFLDASKAFDKVLHNGPFIKMLRRNVPVCLVLLLPSWYGQLQCTVRWQNNFGECFPVSNQIKSNLFCHKFGTQYNNEFALHLAGQTGDNFALMSAHDN